MRNPLQYIRNRQRKIERMLRKRKHSNNRKNNSIDYKKVNNSRSNKRKVDVTYEKIILPADSRFIENIDAISSFVKSIIDKVESDIRDTPQGIFWDLSNVTNLDEAMINLLLTISNYLGILGYDYVGNFPKDNTCRTRLEMSGFFKHVKTSATVKPSQDCIFTLSGDDKTNDEAIGAEIKKIIKSLIGESESYQPLYTTLGEIAANSVEHANADKQKKNWFMSVHYEQNRVLVMMADIGAGILKTMNLLWPQKVMNDLKNKSSDDILKNMFAGKYQSRTREKNRNNGLPDMIPRVQSNFLNNIIVISNDAVYDFSGVFTRTLNVSFPGTFYLIELTKANIIAWQNRLK